MTFNGALAEVPAKKCTYEMDSSETLPRTHGKWPLVIFAPFQVLNGASMSAINASTLANSGCLEKYRRLSKELRAQLS